MSTVVWSHLPSYAIDKGTGTIGDEFAVDVIRFLCRSEENCLAELAQTNGQWGVDAIWWPRPIKLERVPG